MLFNLDREELYVLITLLKREKHQRTLGVVDAWSVGPLIEKFSGKLYDTKGT